MSERYEQGMQIRREVLGDAHVDAAEARKTSFDEAFQNLITEGAWGSVWARETISLRERSMLTIALLQRKQMAAVLRAKWTAMESTWTAYSGPFAT